jgi:hypothetical protein
MARKPWKCRLRLHDWDDRENPETHERYEVCLRCNAHRDRGRAYPGAGASGMTGRSAGRGHHRRVPSRRLLSPFAQNLFALADGAINQAGHVSVCTAAHG